MSDTFVEEVAPMSGAAALPRSNGELVFDAPWQGRVVALAVALVERLGLEWDAFRQHLIAAMAEDPSRPYYESWTVALERFVLQQRLVTKGGLARAQPTDRAPW